MSPSLEMGSLDVIVEVKVSSYWRGAGRRSHMTGVLKRRAGETKAGTGRCNTPGSMVDRWKEATKDPPPET